ncbi:alpha/beta hydrolase [Undibacterium sp.]|uniref:alpha/beta hydrolase n=1 Tax=Undibacterium sp. TaxID=1914977 RepID=UPI002CF4CC22|nr:alpha/beta hydrolase [Undibacterium sp.]HTD05421.1 alpha/beta hydrolase [Undibacterium sp.]
MEATTFSTRKPTKKTAKAAEPRLLIENLMIPGPLGSIPVRLYSPQADAALPVVLYFHGGGFISGSLDDADIPARFIARNSAALVLSVGYSLAPAKPFPAAPEDAYAAMAWVEKNAAAINADASRVAVAGDDAGGNLATCLTLIARDRNATPILAQALIGPMLDPSMTRLGDAKRLNSDLTAQECANCYRQYLPVSLQRLHPYAAPLESRRLGGLPPAFIATAECDVLHIEAEKYAAALITVGVPTQVARFAGIKHASLREHVPALNEIAEFLRRRLAAGSNLKNIAFEPTNEDHHA